MNSIANETLVRRVFHLQKFVLLPRLRKENTKEQNNRNDQNASLIMRPIFRGGLTRNLGGHAPIEYLAIQVGPIL